MLQDALEVDSTCYVRCGSHTMLAVERVGVLTFQLESDYTLRLARVLYVPVMRFNVVLVSILEDEIYALHFQDGAVFIYHKRAGIQDVVMIGIRDNQ